MITWIAIVACWAGMIAAIGRARRALAGPIKAGTIDHLCLIGLAAFLFQTVFDGLEHVSYYPHYHTPVWIIYVMFAYLAFDALPRWFGGRSTVARLTVPAYAVSLLFTQIVVAWQIARNGGSRGDHYGAVLSNQIQVVKEIGQFSDASPLDIQVDYWQARPDTLRVLRQLVALPTANGPVRQLVVRFRNAFPGDARIVVESFPVSNSQATRP